MKRARLWSIAMQGKELVTLLEKKTGLFVEMGFKTINAIVENAL